MIDGQVLSWSGDDIFSEDNTLRLWGTDGKPLATLTGHTKRVTGAVGLADGRILSWSSNWDGQNPEMRLWEADGTPIDVLEQSYYNSDRQIIGYWAEKHGYTLNDFYPPKEKDLLMAGGRVQWEWNSTNLIITHPQTGETIHTFYGDAPFSRPVVLDGGQVVAAGDEMGRVLFLRWVGEG
ncbi:MAG: hypothetical protein MUE54_13400 [Anaerolineae bacterium]|nr:hypothetical protein [Anaerolineae bacterium]